ncbi:hypothetical protein GF312_18575 [Candidatus Poribacteria bacterium]|nr:hypothetical protein [Candidatus Poribacteria bacterium]
MSNQLSDGKIYDPIIEKPTPDNQYALTFFILAAMVIGDKNQDTNLISSAEKTLKYYLKLPSRSYGCHEFNNLALIFIYERLNVFDSPEKFKSDLEKRISNFRYQAKIGSGTSNNWFAIRAVCHLMKHKLFQSQKDRDEAEFLLKNYILKWQLKDGLFYDYPDDVNPHRYATPLTYHAKICSMLCLCYELNADDKLLEAIIKGLSVLGKFIAPDGEAFYYGRSNNAIFGYASAIFAYEKAVRFNIDNNTAQRFLMYARRLFDFLKQWQQPDGHICVVTNSEEKDRTGWDVYTHNVVYNAYTVALLALLSETDYQEIPKTRSENGNNIYNASEAGLLRIQNQNTFLALSTKGQSITKGSILFADLRYHGMNILTLKYKGRTVIPPPPLMWNLENRNDMDLVDPRFCGFQPFISLQQKGQEYLSSVRVYDEINVTEEDDVTTVFASGKPTIYTKPSNMYEISTKIGERLGIGKSVFFNVKTMQNLRLHYCILCFHKIPVLIFAGLIEYDGKISNLNFCSFSARILSREFEIVGNKVRCEIDGETLWVEKVYPESDLKDLQNIKVATSRGSAQTLYQMENNSTFFVNALYFGNDDEKLPNIILKNVDSDTIELDMKLNGLCYNISLNTKEKKFNSNVKKC